MVNPVRACILPLLVLMGNDLYHPQVTSREIAALAPRAELVESWKDPAVVGVMEIVREAYDDPNDPKQSFALVDVRPLMPAQREVGLRQIKTDPRLQHLALVRQSRLSVSPVDDRAWRLICDLAGIKA